jgi:lambda family phage portal protein
MYRAHPDDPNLRLLGLGTPVAIPASQVVHMKAVRRPGMLRGEPWLTRAIIKLYDLDKYDDAQLIKQQIAAMFSAFVSPSVEGVFALSEDADEEGVALASLEPGTVQQLPPGADVKFAQPPGIGDAYAPFNHQQHLYIAQSLGMLYEELTGDFTKGNDRTWRAAFNSFKRKLERHQFNIVVFQYCLPILRRWAEIGMISGIIKPPKGVTIDDICEAEWMPPAHAYINPVQDVQAQNLEVRSGFTSRAQKVSERGYDVEDIDNENRTDSERADNYGLVYDSNAKHVSQAGVTQARPGGSGFAEPGTEPEPKDDGGDNGSFGQ